MNRFAFSVLTLLLFLTMLSCNTPIPNACIGTNLPAGVISLRDTLYLNGECCDNAYYYHWDFGDGNSTDGLFAQHTYTREGVFTIKLTATTKNKTKSDEASIVFSVQK